MSAYLNGFHFYADDMGRQVEANHYCMHLNEDFHQCVIYDSNLATAKLIGIEYIVSERVFKTLPDDERRLWHSHNYEVKSGELIAPGVPEVAGHASCGIWSPPMARPGTPGTPGRSIATPAFRWASRS